ncbi:MAG: phytanoyl-CoA dioxygenase family protein [Ignavibacteriales bacterium]|nr:phytanoyl-CoA dioxygenase family protein [Ignavibacteriales bacterium]
MPAQPHFNLSKEYPVAAEQREAYQRDGHIILRGVASSEEVEFFRPLITGLVDEVAQSKDAQGRITDYSKMFTQVSNVWRKDEHVRQFILARRFAKIAADLMGVNGVRLYHDQALIKEPGGKPTPWHQDYYYWPLATEHTITMWMPLVDVPREMGSMSFAVGSHHNKSFTEMPISDTSQEYFERIIVEQRCATPSYALKAGDATFHSGKTLHSAQGNGSNCRREVITIIYYADGTRIIEPDNEHRKVDMQVFHPGQKPGELAASELNPLLYSKP